MTRNLSRHPVAVIDFETDPFKFGRVPKPFCVEFYSDDETFVAWGDDCADKLIDFLASLKTPHLIYAHNGGKFDFHFLHKHIDNPARVIKSRIVSAKLLHHTLRDSYAIIPVPLRNYEKDEIDYKKMERVRREKHKEEILSYLHTDCISLHKLVSAFIERFGRRLTIGSTAMKQIEACYDFKRMAPELDTIFRPFYFGGRVQCFASGVLKGPWKYFDVNSMYPKAMRDRKHPRNCQYDITDKMPRNFKAPFFLHFEGRQHNALPSHSDTGLNFLQAQGEFHACSHELEIALDHKLVTIDRVITCYRALDTISFEDYVDTFYKEKAAAKKAGDKAGEIFAKLLLNSGYGKFGQNPDNFLDYLIVRDYGHDLELEDAGYSMDSEFPDFELWSRPAPVIGTGLYDVSIAASITSAARAILLDGLQHAKEPIYCDTDSIICKDLKREIHPTKLGAWDLEAQAPWAVITGKKMYSLFNKQNDKKPTKLVSKGGTLSLQDLIAISKGKTVTYENAAPTFSLKKKATHRRGDLSASFVKRRFRMTVDQSAENADDD